ncbi:MAG: hypothetical protein J4N66_10915 [Chloroflexi bacterium]|nr:hypothetical protein [Chloroflexota bacterium]
MRIGTSPFEYDWISDWAEIPNQASAVSGWAHHGMAVTDSGEVIAIHPAESLAMMFDQDGKLVSSFEIPVREAHQLTLANVDDEQFLWIADPGRKNVKTNGAYEPAPGKWGGQVVRVSLAGERVQQITAPPHAAYNEQDFAPTSVAVFENTRGGNGDVWVTDGYGASLIHRFDSAGKYVQTINGEEGDGGRFNCPHGIWVDYRKSDPELYIADRTNRQVQVYDLEGAYKRTFGKGLLTSPSCFAIDGLNIIVGELRARLAMFDVNDDFLSFIGENEAIARVERNSPEDVPGWPNGLDDSGNAARSTVLEEGKFNSPHGIATDPSGNIYSGEWLIGGRYTKLAKLGS